MKQIIVIGGGPSGMIAAIMAANHHNTQVTLIEKNKSLGNKLLLTGGGRCNITNVCDPSVFFDNINTNANFFYSAYYNFDPHMLMDFFNKLNIQFITEGTKVFPTSFKANHIVSALENTLNKKNVTILLNTEVLEITKDKSIILKNKILKADKIIVATGGLSYQHTGSTGDGYKFASSLGHTILPLKAALVAINLVDDTTPLAGITLNDACLIIKNSLDKIIYQKKGELLFTHKGISGPLAINASYHLLDTLDPKLIINLCNDLTNDILLDIFSKNQNKSIQNTLEIILPKKLIAFILQKVNIDNNKKTNSITKLERQTILNNLTAFELTIKDTAGFDDAITTKGGIATNQINPSTMESKLIRDVFFVGELIDIDACTGGFNLQIAFSTGVLAGENAT